MSGMLSVVQKDRIHLVADAAFYDPDTGILTGIGPKIWPFPKINAAFSSRGSALSFPLFRHLLEAIELATFDDFVSVAPDAFQSLYSMLGAETCEVMVAGFSTARDRPEVYWWCNHKGWDGLEPGNVYRLEGVSQFGLDRDDLPSAEAFTPTDAVSAFQKGREHLSDLHCGAADVPFMAHAIGGGVLHIELTADGCNGSWLHEWPDVIGEKIDPLRDEQPAVDWRQGRTTPAGCPLGAAQLAA
ncbi:hypothetical protein NBH19_25415 [Rhizobium sp. S95]|uniref:Uncharacterized protein n=1 Tax=Ciceribacter sichuanensis TaxID=2949647 RepID=A0AAJ1F9V5_9HYPH|nr:MULTISPECIES: hypothetical protein [unclassified Ciceribacter]MCM2399429.1 hypothetical protein [Ciceribacter sp. S95]MCO5959779.1 hypothetical protein [Ciceribacter sp. S101]